MSESEVTSAPAVAATAAPTAIHMLQMQHTVAESGQRYYTSVQKQKIFQMVAIRMVLSLLAAAAFVGCVILGTFLDGGFASSMNVLYLGAMLGYGSFFLVVGLMSWVFINHAADSCPS